MRYYASLFERCPWFRSIHPFWRHFRLYKLKKPRRRRKKLQPFVKTVKDYLLPSVSWRGTSDHNLTIDSLRRNLRSFAVSRSWTSKRASQSMIEYKLISRFYRRTLDASKGKPPKRRRRGRPDRLITSVFKMRLFDERIGQSTENQNKTSLFIKLHSNRDKFNPLICTH
jgi:hypothetical protein